MEFLEQRPQAAIHFVCHFVGRKERFGIRCTGSPCIENIYSHTVRRRTVHSYAPVHGHTGRNAAVCNEYVSAYCTAAKIEKIRVKAAKGVPASAAYETSALIKPELLVEVEAIAVTGSGD